VAAVGVQRNRAEQRGELPRRGAPQQIHLEITFLRVYVTERAHGVVLVPGVDGDHAQGIALDGERRGQAGQIDLTIELRQAAAQQSPQGQGQDDEQQQR